MFGEDKLWFAHIFDELFWLPEPASTLALVVSGFVLRTVVSALDKYVLGSESKEKCSLNWPGHGVFSSMDNQNVGFSS